MEAPDSPQKASRGLVTEPVVGEQPQQRGSSPGHPMTSDQRSPPTSLSPSQQSLPPRRLSPQIHRTHGYRQSEDTVPPSCSPEPSCSFTSTSSTIRKTPTDDNSSSSDSLQIVFNLGEFLRKKRDVQPSDDSSTWGDENEPGVTTPKVDDTDDSKQCEISTNTELELWEHTRVHIEQDRLPFKCDKCSYSSVSESMLSSHDKFHTNVYQYRCSDCSFSTKHLSSLNTHLRKENHNPTAVINPDSSENSLPIVDVNGTRRGPKRPENTVSSRLFADPSLFSMFSSQDFMPSQTMPYDNTTMPDNTLNNPVRRNPQIPYPSNLMVHIPYPSYLMVQDQHTPPTSESDNSLYNTAISNIQQSTIDNNQEGVKEYFTIVISTPQDIIASTADVESQNAETSQGKQHGAPEPDPQEEAADTVGQTCDQSPVTTSRRKGKGFKLEKIAQRLHQSSDKNNYEPRPKKPELTMTTKHPEENVEDKPGLAPSLPDSEDSDPSLPMVDFAEEEETLPDERKKHWEKAKEVFDCPHCDMLFGDLVMYTVHMGYHSYKNPFTCNKCGHQTDDRVQFSLHLMRHGHN